MRTPDAHLEVGTMTTSGKALRYTVPMNLTIGDRVLYKTVGSTQAAIVTAEPEPTINPDLIRVEARNVADYPGPVTLYFGRTQRVKFAR